MRLNKFLIFTFTMLFTSISNPILAQDASNDATWEETTEFINSKKSMLSRGWEWTEKTIPFDKFLIEGETLICENAGNCQLTIDLSKLLSVKPVEKYETTFILKLTGNYLECEGHEDTWDYVGVAVIDSEMRPRVIKAFKHLAYLATEKRKAAREASGDKF